MTAHQSSFGVGNFRVIGQGTITILAGSTANNGPTLTLKDNERAWVFSAQKTDPTGGFYVALVFAMKVSGMLPNEFTPLANLISGPELNDVDIPWTAIGIDIGPEEF